MKYYRVAYRVRCRGVKLSLYLSRLTRKTSDMIFIITAGSGVSSVGGNPITTNARG